MLSQLIAVIIGGIISAGTSLIVTQVNNRTQATRDQQAHDRAMKLAKSERLRTAYKIILIGAESYRDVVFQLGFRPEQEVQTTAIRALQVALVNIPDALVTVALENVGEDIKELFDELSGCYGNYMAARETNREFHATVSLEDIEAYKRQLNDLTAQLTNIMQNKLTALERTI
jgi:hypothetical protein